MYHVQFFSELFVCACVVYDFMGARECVSVCVCARANIQKQILSPPCYLFFFFPFSDLFTSL